jgi:hypothetical protein
MERSRLHQWLCFIGTELHKGLFVPLLDKTAPPEAKTYVWTKNLSRLDYLDNYLKGREFLLDHFSVADAYLVTVINWTMATPPIELAKWPTVKAYYERLRARPQHRQGVAEEFELYKAEHSRGTRRRRMRSTPFFSMASQRALAQAPRHPPAAAPAPASESGDRFPIAMSLMLASRRRIRPCSSNSHCSLP